LGRGPRRSRHSVEAKAAQSRRTAHRGTRVSEPIDFDAETRMVLLVLVFSLMLYFAAKAVVGA